MMLTLEINGTPAVNMQPENNKEVYAITEAWMKLMDFIGLKDFQIYKTFQSKINAFNQQQSCFDDSELWKTPKQYQCLVEMDQMV